MENIFLLIFAQSCISFAFHVKSIVVLGISNYSIIDYFGGNFSSVFA